MTDFTLPELGENIKQGDVLRVLVKPGDTIAKDQPVLELETDKATIEVPSSVAGQVKDVRVKAGDKVKVGQAILSVDDGGAAKAPEKTPAKEAPPAKAAAPAAPSVRRTARELGVDINEVAGTSDGGRISVDDVKAHVKRLVTSSGGAGRGAAAPGGGMALPDFTRWGDVERLPMRAVRRKT